MTRYADLKARGVLGEGGDFPLFVLGRYTPGQVSRPADLLPFFAPARERLPLWAICAFGPRENACALAAAALGGHVRVGFENSLLAPDGRPAESNAAQIRRAAEGATLLGRPLADADTARAMMA
ncbi:3-keto-5-aminohexanoate cleavage enzyme [Methylorubrum podarium]|nr:3-keto-5-aminohexanoate cleavage enzyme [Methylorubrum podarium]